MPKNNSTQSDAGKRKWIYVRWFLLRAALVAFDIVAVNAAHYLALVTRFYVAQEFHSVSSVYFTAFAKYAPIYTVCCLVVFAGFRLYSGIWKAAGLSDLNRVFFANIICFAGHVAGTMLFGIRMPLTFYCIGAVVQLCLITLSRFSYSLVLVEKQRFFGNKVAVNTMVIGMGGTARSAVRAMENDSAVHPVCMVDYKNESLGGVFDGVPVVSGIENVKSAIEKYQVRLVLLASSAIPQSVRAQVRELCAQMNVEVQDYAGYFQNISSGVTLKTLAECCSGPVEIEVGGSSHRFEDCEQAMIAVTGKYVVKSLTAKGGVLHVELGDSAIIQNDLNEEWVKNQQKETGEEISFF